MQLPAWVYRLLIAGLMVAAFFAGTVWGSNEVEVTPPVDCSNKQLPTEYAVFIRLLREFDDGVTLAINVSRDQVAAHVEKLQGVRREVEAIQTPDCLLPFKMALLTYMNQTVDLLVAFTGGVSPNLVLQGLESTQPLRAALEAEIGSLTGQTPTPYPTPFQFESLVSIPVTGIASPTSSLGYGLATVTHGEGVNLREGPGVNFAFRVVLQPGMQAIVLGKSADEQWILVESIDLNAIGWVFVPLITIETSIQELPIVEITPTPSQEGTQTTQ